MTTTTTTAPTDAEIRTGKYLGRFIWHAYQAGEPGGDWYPDPGGTHDGYIYRLGFYCLETRP